LTFAPLASILPTFIHPGIDGPTARHAIFLNAGRV
jgi:hypothetical protein